MANEKQKDYWTHGVVKKWLSLAQVVESRFANINALILAQAALKPGERVLDIGCGPGTTSLAACLAVGPTGSVCGVDISAPMLEAAREQTAAMGLEQIEFVLADAQTEHFTPAFDVLISRFGVMFFDDAVAAMANLRRSVTAQGRLAFAAWGPLAENLHWSRPLEIVRGLVGIGAVRHPHAPGPMAFADAAYVQQVFSQAGWQQIEVTKTKVWLEGASLDSEAQMACVLGPSAALLEEKKASAEFYDQARALFRQALADYAEILPDGRVRLEATLNIITARA